MTPSVSQNPSLSQFPSSSPSLSQNPSLSQFPSSTPSVSQNPSLSEAPTLPCLSSTTTSNVNPLTISGGEIYFCFNSLVPATSDVTVQTFVRGDVDAAIESYDVIDQDGNSLGQNNGGDTECGTAYDQTDFVVAQATFNTWVATGTVSFIMDVTPQVSATIFACSGQSDGFINLVYSSR
ncbi:expressed unknown protein [Seminavis robusta]|uniref:Uncharacterized protein n=1 Tax=Seminavis robusta TaxID=568900 RepID=A0A9N8HK35_9STRA|nr:expressed unknown protein [Seminavis robusta]|eukprot:Sro808_g205441.1  (179) ;mRNA; f:31152-31770